MAKVTLPLEINGVAIVKVAISVTPARGMGPALDAMGFGEAELANKLGAIAQDIVEALDGSVEGLIVTPNKG